MTNDFLDDALMEFEDDIPNYMISQGEISAKKFLTRGYSLEELSWQNDMLKSFDNDKTYIYNKTAKAMTKNINGYYSKKEFNFVSLAYFTIGVDNIIKENKYIYN